MKSKITAVLALSCFITVFHCGQPLLSDGSGSHTGNPVLTGKVLNQDNTPAAGAIVTMVPVDYVPSLALFKTTAITVACTTDTKGEYQVYSLDSNTYYNFEAKKDNCGIFRDSVRIIQEHHLDDMTLHTMGRIYGICHMPGQNDTNQVRVTLYMPGTRRITKPAIGGGFLFDQVPAGKYQLIIDPTLNTYNAKVMNITLAEGQVQDLDTVQLDLYSPDTIAVNQAAVTGTWGPGKAYRLLSNTSVPAGQTLTILPGTTILLYGVELVNNGKIIIQGTPDSLITIQYAYPPRTGGAVIDHSFDSLVDTTLIATWTVFQNLSAYVGEGALTCSGTRKAAVSHCVFINNLYATYYSPEIVRFVNCVFWKNKYVITLPGQTSASMTNCIFIDNTVCTGDQPSSNAPDYCLFYHNGNQPADSTVKHCLFSDPKFVSLDTLKPDFHLKPGSPCFGAGLNGTDIGLYDNH